MKNTWWAILYGVLCGLLGAGLLYLLVSPPRGKPVELLPAPTAKFLQVYVTGAVGQPGIYALSPGSRVQDAINLAGGFLPAADVEVINLAAFLKDGERIYIPERGEMSLTLEARSPEAGSLFTQRVDINTATQAELESLPEIGPVTAAEIIAYREQHGAFNSIEEIQNVPGIGAKTFDKIKDLITVSDR